MKTKLGNCTLYHSDCLELVKDIEQVDAVITDPPYGVTQNKSDIVVDLSSVFGASDRVIMFSQQPYTTDVISQFRDKFKYDLVWDKVLTSGFLNANRMPLRKHESILIFGDGVYNPQKVIGVKSHSKGKKKNTQNNNYGKHEFADNSIKNGNLKHPTSIIRYSKPHPSVALHRTEKPLQLMEWLIKTYSNKGDTILDPFMGSGTTLVACVKTGRKGIGIEIDEKYFNIAVDRIKKAQQQPRLI